MRSGLSRPGIGSERVTNSPGARASLAWGARRLRRRWRQDLVPAAGLVLLLSIIGPSLRAAESKGAITFDVDGSTLSLPDVEAFLRSADVVEVVNRLGASRDAPVVLTLADGSTSTRAVFSSSEFSLTRFRINGRHILTFSSSYRHDIAAYELDKLLGLGITAPCVLRSFDGKQGSMCLWLAVTMTEWERRFEYRLQPPDPLAWKLQMDDLSLFLTLVDALDANDYSNVLIDADWKIYRVMYGYAFTVEKELVGWPSPNQASDRALSALRGLDPKEVTTVLQPLLTSAQIRGLLARRDALIKLFDSRIADGEQPVINRP